MRISRLGSWAALFAATQQRAANGVAGPTRTVIDTVRVLISDTTHVVVRDTVSVVIAPSESLVVLLGKGLVATATLVVSVLAAVAAWKAASAAKESVTASERQAKAAELEIAATQRSVGIQVEQLAMMREMNTLARQQNATALQSLSQRIREPLKELDPASPQHRKLRGYAHLNETDIVTLESLARGVSGEAITHAARAAIGLRTIDALRQKALSINEMTGWLPTSGEQESWKSAFSEVLNSLRALESTCDRALAT